MTEDFWNSAEISARYTSVKLLGSGGMGTVYLVKDKVLDKLVAIKVLDASLSPQQSIRFQREGKLSAKLNHKNIVCVLDFGISEKNVPYLVMEYLPGKNLGALLKESGPLEPKEALPIFIEICAAMIHSHANGILHRDLKPENIIVSESSEQEVLIKIVDFGIARLKEQDGKLTQSGSIIGSPLYMAPEQSTGVTDERSDIYSIGCLMFATLTGQPPLVGDNPLETLMMHKSSEPLSLSEATKRSFPEELEEIISKCLRKNPADRYQSFSDLNEQLLQLRLEIGDQKENEDGEHLSTRKAFPGLSKTLVAIVSCSILLFGAFVAFTINDSNTLEADKITESSSTSETDTKQSLNDFFDVKEEFGRIIVHSRPEIKDKDLDRLDVYPTIDKLSLNSTHVTGIGLVNWRERHVKRLELNDSPVSYYSLSQICQWPELETLSLKDVRTLTPEYLQLVATKSKISKLAFSNQELDERCLEALTQSKTIRVLDIGDMKISERGIKSVLAIENLRDLRLMQCDLTDDAFQRLQAQDKLNGICFSTDVIDRKKMEKILRLPLRSLGFVNVTLVPSVLFALKGNKKVTELNVTSPGITREQIRVIENSFPEHPDFMVLAGSVKTVFDDGETIKPFDPDFMKEAPIEESKSTKNLEPPFITKSENGCFTVSQSPSHSSPITDKDLSALKSIGHPKISLNVKRSRVTGVGFRNWTKPWVTSLYLDDAPVDYEGLQAIRALPGLQALSLKRVHALTPECLRLLATDSNLSRLVFSNAQLNEQSLSELSSSPTISALEIGDMKISEKGIASLMAIKNLIELELNQCRLTDLAFKRLQKPNKLKRIIFLNQQIDKETLDEILKLKVPDLGFQKVTFEPSVLRTLSGNPRINLLQVISPGIAENERIEIRKTFPLGANFVITSTPSNWLLEDKGKDSALHFMKGFDP